VEALTVTGPVKPLLMFALSTRDGSAEYPAVSHTLMTTRRRPSAHEGAPDELYAAVRAAGLEYITIHERSAFDLGVLPQMRRAIQRIQPDIVETHDLKSHFLFFILRILHAELRNPKWIAYHHGYTRTTWKIYLYQQLDRLTLRHADHVVTVCKPFAEALTQRGVAPRNLSIISNAAPDRPAPSSDAVARARATLEISAEECLVLCVGRLSSEKGQDDLISAFQRTLSGVKVPGLRLVIVGDGPERARLTKLAAPLGRKVLFTGYLADPWPIFHAADIFVLPSHSEGSPLVIFEAMATGVPIIATSVGGIPETLVDSATALLVPPCRPDALAAALAALSSDTALRQRLARAAISALARFSPTAYARNLRAIYERVLEKSAT
jgi:glycosyltransferase involved in cell wall biosynthesis